MTIARVQDGQSQTIIIRSQQAGELMLCVNPLPQGRGFSFTKFSGQYWFSYYFGGFTSASRGESER